MSAQILKFPARSLRESIRDRDLDGMFKELREMIRARNARKALSDPTSVEGASDYLGDPDPNPPRTAA